MKDKGRGDNYSDCIWSCTCSVTDREPQPARHITCYCKAPFLKSAQFPSWYTHKVFSLHSGSSGQMHCCNLVHLSISTGIVFTVDIFGMLMCKASTDKTVNCRMWIKAVPFQILFFLYISWTPSTRQHLLNTSINNQCGTYRFGLKAWCWHLWIQ